MPRMWWTFLALCTCFASYGTGQVAHDQFSQCSATCDEGVVEVQDCNGGVCNMVQEGCNLRPCNETMYMAFRAPWSVCSQTCNSGTKTRSSIAGIDTQPCNVRPCEPVVDECYADILLVIDYSGSMRSHWKHVIDFVDALIYGLPPLSPTTVRVGVILFKESADLKIGFNKYFNKAKLVAAIKAFIKPKRYYMTNIVGAINEMRATFDGDLRKTDPNVRLVGIVVTDGAQNYPWKSKDTALKDITTASNDAMAKGITMISIGIGKNVDDAAYDAQIAAMASQKDYYVKEKDTKNFADLFAKIDDFICTDECARCDYSQGQMWLQYKPNCHQYIVCEPNGKGGYIKHLMTCGSLFWNQAIHTCTGVMTGFCFPGPDVPYTGPPIVMGPCPYVPLANPRFFASIDDPSKIQHCKPGFQFADPPCTCVVVGPITPTCADDLLLHFDFEKDFVDVTCHNAVADQYGTGSVTRVSDSYRSGLVASFDGVTHLEVPFLRTWFAEHYVDGFSVSLYYKRGGGSDDVFGALVTNGDCEDKPGFSMRARAGNQLLSQIRTDSGGVNSLTGNISPTSDGWHHVVWVYDGAGLTVYIDKVKVSSSPAPIQGFLINNDVPMYVGFDCDEFDEFFFDGRMDDLKVWSRALTAVDVAGL